MSMVFPKSISFHLNPHAQISSGNAILNALWEKQCVCELLIVSGIGLKLALQLIFFRLFIASGIINLY